MIWIVRQSLLFDWLLYVQPDCTLYHLTNKIIRIRNEVIDLYCQIAVAPAYARICLGILHSISIVHMVIPIFHLVKNMLFSIAALALAESLQLKYYFCLYSMLYTEMKSGGLCLFFFYHIMSFAYMNYDDTYTQLGKEFALLN